jgi:hypothetical protein
MLIRHMIVVPYCGQFLASGAFAGRMEQRREPRADERFVVTITAETKLASASRTSCR